MNEHIWWYTARATGIVAWALATASVVWGMALSTRALGRRPRAPWLLDLHRYLGGLTVLFVLGHMGSLLLDSFVHFHLRDVLVPFSAPWKPASLAWGIVAFYLLVAVEITSLLRSSIRKSLWRAVHFLSYGVYGLATLHYLYAGSDVGAASRIAMVVSLGVVVFFLAYLFIGPGRAASVARAPAAGPRERPARQLEPETT